MENNKVVFWLEKKEKKRKSTELWICLLGEILITYNVTVSFY